MNEIPAEVIEAEKTRGPSELRVGSVVWRDVERYHRPHEYTPEEHFEPIVITSETKFSWVAKYGWREFKFPKKKDPNEYHKDPDTRLSKNGRHGAVRMYLTWRAVSDEVWGMKNRDPLRKHLDGLLDLIGYGGVQKLRRIATLIGYQEKP